MRIPALVLVAGSLAAATPATDPWQYLGPDRCADYGQRGLADRLPTAGLPERWRIPIGTGYSAPVASQGRIHLSILDGDQEALVCLQAATGKELWRRPFGPGWTDKNAPGPRATPLVQDGRVYAFGSRGRLAAFAEATGEPQWAIDLPSKVPFWGLSGSPWFDQGTVFVQTGSPDGGLLAVEASNGSIRWRSLADAAAYGSLMPTRLAGQPALLTVTALGAVAVDQASGREALRIPWKTPYDVNLVALPAGQDRFLVASGYGAGATLVRIQDGVVNTLWRSRDLAPHISMPIIAKDRIFGTNGQAGNVGRVVCLDLANGQTQWTTAPIEGLGSAHLIRVDGRLLVLGNQGTLLWLDEAGRELGRCPTLAGRCWTVPVLVGADLLVRSDKELACFTLPTATASFALPTIPFAFPAEAARNLQTQTANLLKLPVQRDLTLAEGVKLTLILVPAGDFTMGSPADEPGRREDETRHPARVATPFYLGRTEVSQAQWQAVMGINPSTFKAADNPVEQVNWVEARKFLAQLSAKTGLRCRLPTETEWEWACRAGTATPFAASEPATIVWCSKPDNWASAGGTHSVGTLAANAWGLCDMHGNVGEWCEDVLDPYPGQAHEVPRRQTGDQESPTRVVRGGTWFQDPAACRSAARAGFHDYYRDVVVGLRVLVEVTP